MTAVPRPRPATRFTVPPDHSATEPPEARGLGRDGVRLLVAGNGRTRDRRFHQLPAALSPGDLVVVNTSDTEPAAVPGLRADGRPVVLNLSGPARGGGLVVELRTPQGHRVTDAVAGERVALPVGVVATLVTGHPDPRVDAGSRLWSAVIPVEGGLRAWLGAVGHPIRYSYLRANPLIEAYRTIFATPDDDAFGSAEMPSAGRPFTPAVLDALRARGVGLAGIVLHTGVSSPGADEVPLPERYRVPATAATAINRTRRAGRRVVAVGTTAARAVESAAAVDGTVEAARGWTDLVLGPDRPARVVDGLLTGWHEPEASHLLLLEAVAGPELVGRAYAAATARGYLWHEFGDSCLLLPAHRIRRTAPRTGVPMR